MIGVYDFCGHYEWTFAWLEAEGGEALLQEYWNEAIHLDSQRHARDLILSGGIAGMKQYWAHSLEQEAAGYTISANDSAFRIDMHDCPSKGFLIRNGLEQHADYCDHCIGWIGPLMKAAGFVIDHEHNHCGQCWWVMHRGAETPDSKSIAELGGPDDVRRRPDWPQKPPIDKFYQANGVEDKAGSAP